MVSLDDYKWALDNYLTLKYTSCIDFELDLCN